MLKRQIAIDTPCHFWDITDDDIKGGIISKSYEHKTISGVERYYYIKTYVDNEMKIRYIEEGNIIPHNIF